MNVQLFFYNIYAVIESYSKYNTHGFNKYTQKNNK